MANVFQYPLLGQLPLGQFVYTGTGYPPATDIYMGSQFITYETGTRPEFQGPVVVDASGSPDNDAVTIIQVGVGEQSGAATKMFGPRDIAGLFWNLIAHGLAKPKSENRVEAGYSSASETHVPGHAREEHISAASDDSDGRYVDDDRFYAEGLMSPTLDMLRQFLRRGLDIYFGIEGRAPHAFSVKNIRGAKDWRVNIHEGTITALLRQKLSDSRMEALAFGLDVFLDRQLKRGRSDLLPYRTELREKMDAIYTRLGWDRSIHAFKEIGVQDIIDYLGRQGVADGATAYLVGILKASGKIDALHIEKMPGTHSRQFFELKLRRDGQTLVIESAEGRGAEQLLEVLADKNGIVPSGIVKMYTQPTHLSKIDAQYLNAMWRAYEEAGGKSSEVFYLVGSLTPSGDVNRFRLTEDVGGLEYKLFKILIRRLDDKFIIEGASGQNVVKVLAALNSKGGISLSQSVIEEFAGDIARGPLHHKHLLFSDITTRLLRNIWKSYEQVTGHKFPTLYLVGERFTSGGIGRLSLTKDPQTDRGKLFRIQLRRSGKDIVIEDIYGVNATLILEGLSSKKGFVMSGALMQKHRAGKIRSIERREMVPVSAINRKLLSSMWQRYEQVTGHEHDVLCLVGLLVQTGEISGLRLAEDTDRFDEAYMHLHLRRSGKNFIIENAHGAGSVKLLAEIAQKRSIKLAREFKKRIAPELAALEVRQHTFAPSVINIAMIKSLWSRYETVSGRAIKSLHLGGVINEAGRITGLRLVEDTGALALHSFQLDLVQIYDEIRLIDYRGTDSEKMAKIIFGKEAVKAVKSRM